MVDSLPIELRLPIREGRSEQQLGGKGKDKGRWMVGIKLAWIINAEGKVIAWAWHNANVHDQNFLPLVESLKDKSIVLSDFGFRKASGTPENLKLCPKGHWNSRMVIESTFSMISEVCHAKRFSERTHEGIQTKFAYLAAMFNVLHDLHHHIFPVDAPVDMSLAFFAF